MFFLAYLTTPLGVIGIAGSRAGVSAVSFVDTAQVTSAGAPDCVEDCRQQLAEYFSGDRTAFSVRLSPKATAFQGRVWRQLTAVGFGKTCSYRDLATAVGNPAAVRAVGRANSANPVNIIIPCHRVIGADGSLTGYGGGLWRKQWLLDHERTILARMINI